LNRRRLGALTSKDCLNPGLVDRFLVSTHHGPRRNNRSQRTTKQFVSFTKYSLYPPRVSSEMEPSLDDAQRTLILSHASRLLDARQYPKTICPSEIARAFSAPELQTLGALEWRDTMGAVRQVMWEKREAGEVEVMQKGEVVEVESLEDIRGPIRVRKVRK
jgi:hypothetical protein